jgi:outer membrane receptor protein involved in Fe transport
MTPRSMSPASRIVLVALPALMVAAAAPAFAAKEDAKTQPAGATYIEVTATKIPEDVDPVPAAITVVSGADLRARNATTLADALALVGGVSISPGGDNGSAASVPEIWGLREFDAFLLVVDGVPWGGAFDPDLATLSLENVDRIEVLRGAAPVMYGATSFTGVIQVIHQSAGEGKPMLRATGGSYGTGAIAVSYPLPDHGSVKQSIVGDITHLGYADDRTDVGRGHMLYRLAAPAGNGRFRVDVDVTALRQDPASPRPLVNDEFTDQVARDTNNNPDDARLNDNRFHLVGAYDRDISGGTLSAMLSVTNSRQDIARGFLLDVSTVNPNSEGFTQDLVVVDSYLDIHVALHPGTNVCLVTGFDYLYGRVHQNSQIFDYFVNPDGSSPESLSDLTAVDEPSASDRRNFSGLYAQAEWTPSTRLRFDGGARINHTEESRHVPDLVPDSDSRTFTRGSGTVGVSWLAHPVTKGGLWLFGDYRNTFKPAAFDFGPDPTAEILDPETAQSYEIGVRGRHDDGRATWQFSAFQMDFSNLVITANVGGLPTLVNAGDERFRGVEAEGTVKVARDFHLQGGFSVHDARFTDSVQDIGGTPTQLAGNRLEMSARYLGSAGVVWSPERKWTANSTLNYVGSRFLDEENDVVTAPYYLWNAGFGYRLSAGTVRLDAYNISDVRPPVSVSELGGEQYYIMPARTVVASWVQSF